MLKPVLTTSHFEQISQQLYALLIAAEYVVQGLSDQVNWGIGATSISQVLHETVDPSTRDMQVIWHLNRHHEVRGVTLVYLRTVVVAQSQKLEREFIFRVFRVFREVKWLEPWGLIFEPVLLQLELSHEGLR